MKFQPDKLLDGGLYNISVLDNTPSFEKVSSQGEPTIEDKEKKTDKETTTEELIAQLRQENQQLKQVLTAKDKVIKQLKNPDNLGLNKDDFKLILEGVADGLVIVNNEGKVKFINPAGEKLFARPKSELINYFLGLPIGDENTEVTICRPGGYIIIAEMRVSSITWESQIAYLASLRDVTERQQAQMSLKESEERFRLMADTAPVLIWMTETEGEFTFVSQPWLMFTGQSLEDQLGHNWQHNIHPDDQDLYLKNYFESVAKRTTFEGELRLKHANGEYRWLLSRGVPRFNSDGEFVGYIGSCSDITEHKQLAQTLLQISTAVESSSEAISILDTTGKSIYHNPAFVELFGYSPEVLNEIGGMAKIFSNQDYYRYATAIATLVNWGHSWRGELSIRRGGKKRQLSIHADVIRDNNSKIIGIVITATDITEHKQVQQELQKTNRKLKASVKELETVNHEIILLGKTIELLQACVSLEEAYNLLKTQIPRLFIGTSGMIFNLNKTNHLMESIASWGNCQDSELIFHPEDCWALRRGRLHSIGEGCGLLCPHLHSNLSSHIKQVSLCLPMIARGETLGLLYLRDHRQNSQLSEAKQQFTATVVEHLSLALSNLKLREKLQEECIRDPLTGLFNRRYLEESLERELLRAKRISKPLGIIMVDIDHFKHFNDDYSHEAGDKVLQAVGEFLQQNIRGSDLACRYGGEELTLILPDANLAQTQQRAEQLRLGIKKLLVRYRGVTLQSITASFGVASYPQQGITLTELLSKADTALYQAKENGRDRVVIAEN